MNQAIQFPEREWWDEGIQAVCFTVLVNGFQLVCAIHGEELLRRYHDEFIALEAFRKNRWDIEEEATHAIEQQQENDQGWLWLSSAR
ncbi:DUF1488 domain-containing protein [Erwinia sp. S38]|uniref:DUF1488 domain-containing protein n=1 Tax=Erwinia sp. S38 TaxID=2769338 RepID=UPI001909B4C0|nr:DUF1488 domain-containing protein [Erwinia sp. S38]